MALEQMPYFARILFSLRLLNAPGLGTWAVDGGHRLYIDFDAVTDKSVKWNVESVLHECSHLFAEHKQTAKDLDVDTADRSVWNVAADLSINDDLDEAGCNTFRDDKMLPQFIGEPNGQTPHHYFAVLKKKVEQKQQQQQNGQSGPQGQPDPDCPQHGTKPGHGGQQVGGENGNQPGHVQGQGQASGGQGKHQQGPACTCSDQPQGVGSGQGDEQGPYKGCGSGSGGNAWAGELDESDDLDGQAPAASDAEKETIRLAVAAAIKDHAAKGRGTVPGGLSEIADKVLAPSKTPWQKILASKVRRTVASKAGPFDTDHTRRNRRRRNVRIGGRKALFPGYYQPVPSIELIRDTSGSMSGDDLAVVTREVESIAKKLGIRGEQFVVTDVDAQVHQSQGFKGRGSIREVAGRGGTDMVVGIDAAQGRKNPPTAIVVATDGWTPWPAEKGPVPVIACIVPPAGDAGAGEAAAANVPDFIRAVVVDPAE